MTDLMLTFLCSLAASTEEEVGWDEDSDDETTAGTVTSPKKQQQTDKRPGSTESSTTIQPPTATGSTSASLSSLKPAEPRKSNDERSQPDSDTSYDVVGASSGVPSHAPNSPKEVRKEDDSEEEDWE